MWLIPGWANCDACCVTFSHCLCLLQDKDMQVLSAELIKCGDLVQGAYDGLISKNIHSDSFGEAVLSTKDFISSKGLHCFGEDAKRYTVSAT